MFRRLEIGGWRQFGGVDISFHKHLTVLTGANGSGKTTILSLLSRHMGWDLHFVSTPVQKLGQMRFLSDFWRETISDSSPAFLIGRLTYADGGTADLTVPDSVSQQYDVKIRNRQNVPGIFVSSHRPLYLYEAVEEIPTGLSAGEQLFNLYVDDLRVRYRPRQGFRSPTYHLKRSLISLAALGYGNRAVQKNEEAIRTFEGFQKVLKIILPPTLGFRGFEIRLPEVVLLTDTGDFSLDAASGGVSALIDIAWQVYLRGAVDSQFVVLIDEPENHLHPELQKILLPNLIRAFPTAQFIVATHNPFIVSSVPSSNVYVLAFGEDRHVTSSLLDLLNKAGSSNDILRDVLGLSTTLPVWVEVKLKALVEEYLPRGLDESTLAQLKSKLAELGLAEFLPDTLARLLDGQ